jgi:hypothetical protein
LQNDYFPNCPKFPRFLGLHMNEMLDKLIYINELAVIIVINETSEQLTRVLTKIKIDTDIIYAQSYLSEGKMLHRYTPFQDNVIDVIPISTDLDDLDTVVVVA